MLRTNFILPSTSAASSVLKKAIMIKKNIMSNNLKKFSTSTSAARSASSGKIFGCAFLFSSSLMFGLTSTSTSSMFFSSAFCEENTHQKEQAKGKESIVVSPDAVVFDHVPEMGNRPIIEAAHFSFTFVQQLILFGLWSTLPVAMYNFILLGGSWLWLTCNPAFWAIPFVHFFFWKQNLESPGLVINNKKVTLDKDITFIDFAKDTKIQVGFALKLITGNLFSLGGWMMERELSYLQRNLTFTPLA